MMGGFGYGLGWWGGLGMFAGVAVWVLLIGLVIWAVVQYGRTHDGSAAAEASALEILKRRYARGEISQAEYLQARRDLE